MDGMSRRLTPLSELERRISRLQVLMARNNLDGAVIVQNADLFYFTGTVQKSHLFIPVEGNPVLLVRKNYDRARRESPLETVIHMANLKDLPGHIKTYAGGKLQRIGFEFDVLPVSLYLYYQKLLNPIEVADVSKLIREVRSVKSPYELEILRDAARLNQIMFGCVKGLLREGMTEVELAGKLEDVYRREGHQGYVRMRSFNLEVAYGHLISGWNSAVPGFFDGPTSGSGLNPSFPQGSSFKQIGRDEPVIVDYVGVYDGYMVDQTRLFCLGRLPEKLVRAYNISLEIQELIKERAVPGAICAELYEEALKVAGRYQLAEYFMGFPDPVSFIGHGVGIELDELPVLARGVKTPLEENMVFALEPKFIFPEGAVGIENTFVVTKKRTGDTYSF